MLSKINKLFKNLKLIKSKVIDKTKFTNEEILQDLINNEHSHNILKNSKNDLIMLHHSLGRSIRNEYGLWQRGYQPEIVNGIDVSPNHPDAISQRIIKQLHEYWETHPEELTKRKDRV